MRKLLWLFAVAFVVMGTCVSSSAAPLDPSIPGKLVGKWTQQMAGASAPGATMTITSVDPDTGLIKGKYKPPSGPAASQEFDVVGWASSAPKTQNADNVIVVTFSVSLSTYGSLASWTGYLKDNKIIASWFNARPNAGYEWDHITTSLDVFVKGS